MAKKTVKRKKVSTKRKAPKVVSVREHPRRVKVSQKNPQGVTIVDRHPRYIKGSYLDESEIYLILKNYKRDGILYPAKNRLVEYKDSDKYDDQIAVWTDYFNKKFNSNLDPDMIKALIASESGFRVDPLENTVAIGIAQITKPTHKILQDSKGEVKEFIFKDISQKDLKNPDIAIPMGIRWLYRKKDTAKNKLGREPTHEEIILEYKGWLKSKSDLKKSGLKNYKEHYEKLKSKK